LKISFNHYLCILGNNLPDLSLAVFNTFSLMIMHHIE
jgi:hypothetical protein